MYLKSLLITLLLLWPLSATAVWDVVPGSGAGDCVFATYNKCFSDLASDTTTGIIDTSMCENITAHWVSNIAAATHLNHIDIRVSIAANESANTSYILKGIKLTGNPIGDRAAHRGFDAPWVYGDINTYTAGTGRLALQCFKRRW